MSHIRDCFGRLGVSFGAAVSSTLLLTSVVQAQPARPAAARPAAARPAARPATATPPVAPAAPAVQPAAPAVQPATPAAPVVGTTSAAATQLAAGAAAAVQAQSAESNTLRLAVSSALNGRFASMVCGDNAPAPQAGELAHEFAGEPGALALDAGDFVGSSAGARFAVTRDVAAVASAASAMGLRALAVGHRDLAGTRETFTAAAAALNARRIPYVLTNLVCAPEARSLCDVVLDSSDDPLIIDSPQGKVAYLAVVAPSTLRFIAQDRAAGITLQPPLEAVARATAAARQRGARWVVVAYDPESPAEEDGFRFANELPAEGHPDLLLINGAGERVASMEAARSGVPVVATRSGRAVAVELGGARLARAARSGTAPDEVTTLASGTREWMCQNHNAALRGATLTAPMDRDGFATFFLNVLRDETETEVAIMNRGAVQGSEIFPINGAITGLHLAAAMPFDDRIYVGRVRGSVLKALATSSRAERFHLRGVTTDGGVKINGRPVDENAWYRVATTGFVFDGGEGGLGGDAETVELERFGTQSPREFISAWLDQPHTGDITQIPVDPSRRTRWNFNLAVDLGFQLVNSANPAGGVGPGASPYTDPQLARADTMALRGDVQFGANADHPNWTLQNAFRARYGRASVGNGAFAENLDVISLRSTFEYRGFVSNPRWYIPTPDAELYAETEFDVLPRTETMLAENVFRHLQLRPTLGLRFTLDPKVLVRIAFGMDWMEVLGPADDPMTAAPSDGIGTPTYVILTRATLQPIDLLTLRGKAVTFQAESELAVRQAFSSLENGPVARNGQLRLTSRLAVPIFDALSLTISYDLFGRLSRGNELGVAHDFTVGLNWTWARALQTF